MSFGIVHSDDNHLLIDGKDYLTNEANFLNVFTDRPQLGDVVVPYYRPMFRISYMLDTLVGGYSYFTYHLSNVLMHVVVSCLVLGLFSLFGYSGSFALFAALLFAVHPGIAAAIAWIPGRIDMCLAMFILPSFLFFERYVRSRRAIHLALHLVFFGLSIFTKEIAIGSCVGFPLFLWLIKKENPLTRRNAVFLGGWIPLIALFQVLRHIAMTGTRDVVFSELPKQILLGVPALFNYLGKLLLPFNLSVLQMARDATPVWGIVTCLLVAAALAFSRKRRMGHVVFGAMWILLFLLPAVPVPEIVEHRNYLILVGFLIVVGEIDWLKNLDLRRGRVGAICAAVLLAYAGTTVAYCRSYRGELPYWLIAAKNSPSHPLALVEAGVALFNAGEKTEAEKMFREALTKKPPLANAHLNLGKMAVQQGRLDVAEQEFTSEIALGPSFEANFSLGELYLLQQRWGDAERRLLLAQEAKPAAKELHGDLASAYLGLNRLDQALSEIRQEVALSPDNDRASSMMGFLLARTGKLAEAEPCWKRAISLNPRNFDAYNNLVRYYLGSKDTGKANFYASEIRRRGGVVAPELARSLEPAR